MDIVVRGFGSDSEDEEDPYFDYLLQDSRLLRYTVAGDPGVLFNANLWNGARVLASYLQDHPAACLGASVLEFGAAAGVPSIVASCLGSRLVVASDYPDANILRVLAGNIDVNRHLLSPGAPPALAVGHLWGAPVDDLLAHAPSGFDLLLLADVMWLHDKHEVLLQSVNATLGASGQALVAFSHHVPGHREHDLAFFDIAAAKYGLVCALLTTASLPDIFSEHKLQDVFLYSMTRPP